MQSSQDHTAIWHYSPTISTKRLWATAGLYFETGRLSGTGHTVQPQVKQSKCQLEQPFLATVREHKQSFPNHALHACSHRGTLLPSQHGRHLTTLAEIPYRAE